MRRRLLTLVSAVSLVLCVATLALWVRSYWAWDLLYREWPKSPTGSGYHEVRLRSEYGVLAAGWDDISPNPDDLEVVRKARATQSTDGWEYHSAGPASVHYGDSDAKWLGIAVGYYSDHPRRRGFFTEPPVPPYDIYETNRAVWIPHWLLAAATAVLLLMVAQLRWRAARRVRRRQAGVCPSCGMTCAPPPIAARSVERCRRGSPRETSPVHRPVARVMRGGPRPSVPDRNGRPGTRPPHRPPVRRRRGRRTLRGP